MKIALSLDQKAAIYVSKDMNSTKIKTFAKTRSASSTSAMIAVFQVSTNATSAKLATSMIELRMHALRKDVKSTIVTNVMKTLPFVSSAQVITG